MIITWFWMSLEILSMIIQTVDGERKVADDVKTDTGMFLIIMIIMTIETNKIKRRLKNKTKERLTKWDDCDH